MLANLIELVVHPDAFFERISKEEINLIPPLLIVGTGILLLIIGKTIPVVWISLNSSFLQNHSFAEIFGSLILCHALSPIVVLGIISLGTFVISRGLNGKGSLTANIQNIGYGMIPWTFYILGSLVFSSIIFLVFHAWPGPPNSPEAAMVLFWIAALIGLVVFFWEWYLWILAVRHTHAFTIRKAAAVTIVPVAMGIWLTIPVQAWLDTIWMVIFGI
ncbi:MAG: YIP1 family protein [Methanoregula sp.]